MSASDCKEKAGPQALALTQPASKLLFDYWNALRNGRMLPQRSEVDPAALRLVLPNLFILQRYDSDHVNFRVAGTAICAAFGRELRDHNFIALWERNRQPVIRDLLLRVAETARVAVVRAVGTTLDKRRFPAEVVLLALADNWGAHTRILGIASFGGDEAILGWRKLVQLDAAAFALVDPDRGRIALDLDASVERAPFAFPLSVVARTAPAEAPKARTLAHPWDEHLRSVLKVED